MTQDKMLIGLLSAYEVAQASIDSNCVTPFSNSCRNYNYLATTIKNSNWLKQNIIFCAISSADMEILPIIVAKSL